MQSYVKLSGSLSEDKRLINDLKYKTKDSKTSMWRTFEVVDNDDGLTSYPMISGMHMGVGDFYAETIIFYVIAAVAFICAPILYVLYLKRELPKQINGDGAASFGKKTLLLQGLFLAACIFLFTVCFSHLAFLVMNVCAENGVRMLVPEILPTFITLLLCVITLIIIPLAVNLKIRRGKLKSVKSR